MADMKLIKDMSAALNAKPKQPSPFDTTAEVVRVEGDTAWVHIPGGVDETPVQMSVNAREGDTVRVRVGGGTAWLTGNDTAPPTDDKKAIEAQAKAEEVSDYVATHMEETDAGLVITKDGSGWKLLVASDGIDIIDPNGVSVANYGATARIGQSSDIYVGIGENEITMNSPIRPLVFIEQRETEIEPGELVGGGFIIGNLGSGKTANYAEKIIVSSTYNFIVSGTIGNETIAAQTYTDYGTYEFGEQATITLHEKGFSFQNITENRINISLSFQEYYAQHYNGTYEFRNGNIVLSSGAKVDGVDVSELGESVSGMLNSISNTNTSSTISVPNGTDTTLCNTGSLSAGTYIIKGMASFAEDATGLRRLFFATASDGSVIDRHARVTCAPSATSVTQLQVEYYATISATTTFYLRARQTSGGALDITQAGIQVLKIHA